MQQVTQHNLNRNSNICPLSSLYFAGKQREHCNKIRSIYTETVPFQLRSRLSCQKGAFSAESSGPGDKKTLTKNTSLNVVITFELETYERKEVGDTEEV
jgi:hypothetical protein